MLRVGYAEVDITPHGSIEMVGFNRKENISRGVLKSLLAQVTVWETEKIYCLITIDSIGFKKELTDKLRNIVCKTLNTSVDKVMICLLLRKRICRNIKRLFQNCKRIRILYLHIIMSVNEK